MARRRKSTSEFDGYAVPVGEVALAARLGPAQIEDALERAGVPTFVDWRGHLVVKPADARRFVTETRERNDRHAAEQAEHRKRQQLAEAEARRQAGDPKRFEAAVREAQRQAGVR